MPPGITINFLLITSLLIFHSYAKPNSNNLKTTKEDIKFLEENLPGEWKEDQYKRDNLNNFLWEAGLSWVKRIYATTTSWENEQNIKFEDGAFRVNGKNGPLAKVFEFVLHPDGRTQSVVDLGSDLGGLTDGTAEIKGNSLITYLTKQGEEEIYMHAIRTINKDNPDVMIYETKLFPSEVAMTSVFNRVVKE